MINWIKKHTLITVSVLAILLLLFATYRSCNISKKSAELKGQYEALKGEYSKYKEETEVQITALNTEIKNRDALIEELHQDIDDIYHEIGVKDETITELEAEYNDLFPEVAKIDNLQKQIALWKEKFTLAEEIIARKDKIIFNLNEKYNAQFTITENYKELYQNELRLRTVLEKRVKALNKEIRRKTFGGTLKTGLIVAAGTIIIYGVVSNER